MSIRVNHSVASIATNAEPIFRRSIFRSEEVLISEPIGYLPFVRIGMVIICLCMGLATIIDLTRIYIKYRLKLKQTILHRIIVPILLLLNVSFHVAHYSHNIYNPAAYFEPKKLYIKRIITEMEPTFFFNFPLTIVFVIASRKLLIASMIEQSRFFSMPIMITLYSFMSMISGGHYTYEPARYFSVMCNITIAGEAISAFLLMLLAWLVHRLTFTVTVPYMYTRLTHAKHKKTSDQTVKQKLSDNTSSENELS